MREEQRPLDLFRDLLSQNELAVILRIFESCFNVQTSEQLLSVWTKLDRIIPIERVVGVVVAHDRESSGQRAVKILATCTPAQINACLESAYSSDRESWFHSLLAEDGTRVIGLDGGDRKSRAHGKVPTCLRTMGYRECVASVRTAERQALKTAYLFMGKALTDDPRNVTIIDYLAPHFHSSLSVIGTKEFMPIKALSSREKEVLRWISAGKTSWETSRILRITERTVIFHAQNAKRKLGAASRAQAIALALQHGLLQGSQERRPNMSGGQRGEV